MVEVRTVVVGIDGSAASVAALEWATARFAESGAVHAVEALEGDEPADVLLDQVEQRGADLLVVGAHGAGEGSRRSPFIGSVTRTLLGRADVPLVVHHGSADASDGPVIASVGYGPPSDAAVRFAAAYADEVGRSLVLLHAISRRPLYPIDSPVDMLGSYLGPGVNREWAEADLASRRDEILERFPTLPVSTRTALGSAVRAVLDAAAGPGTGLSAEMVAIGRPSTRRLPPSPRLYQFLARAKWPTAVVPICLQKD